MTGPLGAGRPTSWAAGAGGRVAPEQRTPVKPEPWVSDDE